MACRRVLVVGSSGILRPAVEALRADGVEVVAVSQTGADGSIAVDARDRDALETALEGRSWCRAVVYRPAVSAESLAFVRAATSERCVVVLTSDAADPALGDVVVPADTLLLGWDASGAARWHRPAEVSEAALAVLADGAPRILGSVRPWGGRP